MKSTALDRKDKSLTTLNDLVVVVRNTIHELLQISMYDTKLEDDERIRERREQLRKSIKACPIGDTRAKAFIKEYILDILQTKLRLTEEDIEKFITFGDVNRLSMQDKFDIVLYSYRIEYGTEALEKIIEEYNLDRVRMNEDNEQYFEISYEDIDNIYYETCIFLDFYDKLQILTQRVYAMYIGNGVIDELIEMRVDGISAGVSGILRNLSFDEEVAMKGLPASYESVWMFYHGKSIYLSFLKFPCERELIRVCKNIYRYNYPGYLSQVRGYIVNELYDGSRVAVARPPFCEGWVLFLRKFQTSFQKDIHSLLIDNNCILPIQMMKWLIKGCQVIAITGEQGAGKTTLLMSLIRYICPEYNLRVQELSFELHLRKVYPCRNIVSFKETDSVSGMAGLDFMKKTDGSVNILGEVASAKVASWLITMSQVASLFTLFTHHAKTTRDLVFWMRNALLLEGGFQNESAALRQVIDAVQIDIHMAKHKDGHRFIERISYIIPKRDHGKVTSTEGLVKERTGCLEEEFEILDLLVFKEGRYCMLNPFTEELISQITHHLSSVEKEEFIRNMGEWEAAYE